MCLAPFESYHCLKLVNKSQWKKLQYFNEKYYKYSIKYIFTSYVIMYGNQVLPDLIMLLHCQKAQKMKHRICLYPRHDNKISFSKHTEYIMQHGAAVFSGTKQQI
jgi:hypothetical protein